MAWQFVQTHLPLSGRLGYDGLFRAAVDASVCAIWVAPPDLSGRRCESHRGWAAPSGTGNAGHRGQYADAHRRGSSQTFMVVATGFWHGDRVWLFGAPMVTSRRSMAVGCAAWDRRDGFCHLNRSDPGPQCGPTYQIGRASGRESTEGAGGEA